MKRSGSVTVLFLLMLTAVIAVGAVAVDYAMMESARTDLRIASDLCSRAAVVKYIDTGSLSAARTQAKELAQVNQLFGRNVLLADADIVPGNSASQTNGKYVFTANAQPYNSFRVDARFASDSLNNSLPLLFSSVHHRQTIDLAQTSTSTETNLDVVLVLDRSGSMAFDLTGTDWSYPDHKSWVINYYVKPQTDSRWDRLERAVGIFLEELDKKEKKENVALVSYSSQYTTWSSYFSKYFYSNEVQTDCNFTQTYSVVDNAVQSIGNQAIVGGTAISSGMDRARTLLMNSPRAAYSEKIIVLMTDGQWNDGYDPVTAANTAAANNIVIHTVSFGSGSNATVMQNVASATGGKFYDAPGATELEDAFRSIAQSIGLSYTE